MIAPTNAAEAVAAGAQLLDEKEPGWWRRIDLSSLEIADCKSCICGQLGMARAMRYSEYVRQHLELLGLSFAATSNHSPSCYGFDILLGEANSLGQRQMITNFHELDEEWTKAILTRLEADKLAAETEEREMVSA